MGITHVLKSDFHFGRDANGRDVKFWSDTSGDFILFDASDNALKFTDCDIKFTGTERLYFQGTADFIYSAGAGTLNITSAAITLTGGVTVTSTLAVTGATTLTGLITSANTTGTQFLAVPSSTGATFVSDNKATGTAKKLAVMVGTTGTTAFYINVYTT